jgi:hypothetical protein
MKMANGLANLLAARCHSKFKYTTVLVKKDANTKRI